MRVINDCPYGRKEDIGFSYGHIDPGMDGRTVADAYTRGNIGVPMDVMLSLYGIHPDTFLRL